MSLSPSPERPTASAGAFAGVVAFVFGLAVVIGSGVSGFRPTVGVFERVANGTGYLLVHQAVHLPVWEGAIHWTVLPYTAVLGAVLVLAGAAVADRRGQSETAGRTGQSVLLGYAPLTLFGSVALVVTHGAVTAIRMVAPTLLVGVFFPALFGGIGGVIAGRYRERADG